MIVVVILVIIAVVLYALSKNKNSSNDSNSNQPQPKPTSTPIIYNLPNGINRELYSLNPYRNKYRDNTKEDALYLLNCDYSTAYRWIQDASKPDVFFSNYTKAIQLLETIVEREPKAQQSTQQLHNLKVNYSHNVNLFISRYWNATVEEANKLKTEKGKQNRLQKFFDTLFSEYSNYLLEENLTLINSFKSNPEPSKVNKQTVECGNYDVSTVENIERISNNSFDAIRPLQKAATAHKRNDDIELAIACLRKSNELSDSLQTPAGKLMEKEYLRVLNYIALLEQPELVKAEEDIIRRKHPEFWDKRVSARRKIQEGIATCNKFDNDLIEIFTNSHCPICSKYNHQIYSISGTHKIYQKLPDVVLNQAHECKECIWGVGSFYEGINS